MWVKFVRNLTTLSVYFTVPFAGEPRRWLSGKDSDAFVVPPAVAVTTISTPEAFTKVALPTWNVSDHDLEDMFNVIECLIPNLAEPTGLPLRSRLTPALMSSHSLVRVTTRWLMCRWPPHRPKRPTPSPERSPARR
ncbi:hypothetical protein ABZ746_36280 [Streptomyces sp. NPDC020096]